MQNNLSKIMGEKLMTATAVNKASGVSKHTIHNIYYRRMENVELVTLMKLCDCLNVKLSELIEYDPKAIAN